MDKLALKAYYEKACNEYIKAFCKKQGIEFDYWISDEVGGIAQFIDQYFFDMQTIRHDIDTNQPKGLIMQWQNDCVDNGNIEREKINYKSYSKGIRFETFKT